MSGEKSALHDRETYFEVLFFALNVHLQFPTKVLLFHSFNTDCIVLQKGKKYQNMIRNCVIFLNVPLMAIRWSECVLLQFFF